MREPLKAVDVIRQSHQGYSIKPFIIRADNDKTYFVKGLSKSGGSSLVSEALAAELGRRIGLPIPPWRSMIIPPELIRFSQQENITDLSGGLAFASQQVESSSDFLLANAKDVPEDMQRKVLAFDWWIRNEDRALSAKGGNVNLLLNKSGELAVIDHNIAFDTAFNAEKFKQSHVFRSHIPSLRDIVNRLYFDNIFAEVLQDWQEIIELLPEDWVYQDSDHIDYTKPDLSQRLKYLQSFVSSNFWGDL